MALSAGIIVMLAATVSSVSCSCEGGAEVLLVMRKYLREGVRDQTIAVRPCPLPVGQTIEIDSVALITAADRWNFTARGPDLSGAGSLWSVSVGRTARSGDSTPAHILVRSLSRHWHSAQPLSRIDRFPVTILRQPHTVVSLQTNKLRYSPYEKIYIRAVATDWLGKPKKVRIDRVQIVDSYGIIVDHKTNFDTSALGVLNVTSTTTAAVGEWTVQIVTKEPIPYRVKKHFKVGEFAMPNFALEVSIPPQKLQGASSLEIDVQAKYYFNKAIQNTSIDVHVWLDDTLVCPLPGCHLELLEAPGHYVVSLNEVIDGQNITVKTTVSDPTTFHVVKADTFLPQAQFHELDSSASLALFTPGLPYTFTAVLTTIAGEPGRREIVEVLSTDEANTPLEFTIPDIDSNGRLTHTFQTTHSMAELHITAKVMATGQTYVHHVKRGKEEGLVVYDPRGRPSYEIGETIDATVEAKGVHQVRLYVVEADDRGAPIETVLNSEGSTRSSTVYVESSMAPLLTLIAVGFTTSGQVVTGTMKAPVKRSCQARMLAEVNYSGRCINIYGGHQKSFALLTVVESMWFDSKSQLNMDWMKSASLGEMREVTARAQTTSSEDPTKHQVADEILPQLNGELVPIRWTDDKNSIEHVQHSLAPKDIDVESNTLVFDQLELEYDLLGGKHYLGYKIPGVSSRHSSYQVAGALLTESEMCILDEHQIPHQLTFFVEMDAPRQAIVGEQVNVRFTLFNYDKGKEKKVEYRLCFSEDDFCSSNIDCDSPTTVTIKSAHFRTALPLVAKRTGFARVTLHTALVLPDGSTGPEDKVERVIHLLARTHTKVVLHGSGEVSIQHRVYSIQSNGYNTTVVLPDSKYSNELNFKNDLVLTSNRHYCVGSLLQRALAGDGKGNTSITQHDVCPVHVSEQFRKLTCLQSAEYCQEGRCSPEELSLLANCTLPSSSDAKVSRIRKSKISTRHLCERAAYELTYNRVSENKVCSTLETLRRRQSQLLSVSGMFYELGTLKGSERASDANKSLTGLCLVSLRKVMAANPSLSCSSGLLAMSQRAHHFLSHTVPSSCLGKAVKVYSCFVMGTTTSKCKGELRKLLKLRRCRLSHKSAHKTKRPDLSALGYTLRSLLHLNESAGRLSRYLLKCEDYNAHQLKIRTCIPDSGSMEPPHIALEALAKYDSLNSWRSDSTFHLEGNDSSITAVSLDQDLTLSEDDAHGGVNKVHTPERMVVLSVVRLSSKNQDTCEGFQLKVNANYVLNAQETELIASHSPTTGELELCFSSAHDHLRVLVGYDQDSYVNKVNVTEGVTVTNKTHQDTSSTFVINLNTTSKECLTIRMNVSRAAQKQWPVQITPVSPQQESSCKQDYKWTDNSSTKNLVSEPNYSGEDFAEDFSIG